MKVQVFNNRSVAVDGSMGTKNENNVTELEIDVPKQFEDFNKKIVFLFEDREPIWDIIENNTYTLTKAITKYSRVKFYVWLTNGDEDFRSREKELTFYNNKDASDQITEEEINGVNKVINILDEEITKVTELEKELKALISDIQHKLDNGEFNGKDGLTPYIKDGFWYIGDVNTDVRAEAISISSIKKTNEEGLIDEYTITFSNNATFVYYVRNGKDGVDGQDYVVTQDDYKNIASIVEKDIQPTLNDNLKSSKDYTDNAIVKDFKDISYDEETATFIFTRHDNTTFIVDLPIEQTVKNGWYDEETAELVLILVSEQEIRIPVSGLIDDYTGVDSATIQVVISADNKITCNIIGQSISKTLLTTELQEEINNKVNKSSFVYDEDTETLSITI